MGVQRRRRRRRRGRRRRRCRRLTGKEGLQQISQQDWNLTSSPPNMHLVTETFSSDLISSLLQQKNKKILSSQNIFFSSPTRNFFPSQNCFDCFSKSWFFRVTASKLKLLLRFDKMSWTCKIVNTFLVNLARVNAPAPKLPRLQCSYGKAKLIRGHLMRVVMTWRLRCWHCG